MSRFTNDVDTITEALNGSFTMLIESFITIIGTFSMLLILSWRLSLIVFFFLAVMFAFIKFNSARSRKYFVRQQMHLGSVNGFVEEIVTGQKVEKVFNHEPQDFEEFCRRNEAYRQAAVKALTYSGLTIPTVVSLGYVKLRGVGLRGRTVCPLRPHGPGHAGLLPGVCAPELHAHQPLHPAD